MVVGQYDTREDICGLIKTDLAFAKLYNLEQFEKKINFLWHVCL